MSYEAGTLTLTVMFVKTRSKSVVPEQFWIMVSVNDVETVFVPVAPKEGYGMLAVSVTSYWPTSAPDVGLKLILCVVPLKVTNNGVAIATPPFLNAIVYVSEYTQRRSVHFAGSKLNPIGELTEVCLLSIAARVIVLTTHLLILTSKEYVFTLATLSVEEQVAVIVL
jgi:hypothetical protein